MTWKYWVSGPMLVPLVSTCHEIESTDYSSALAFLSGSKCAVTHSYSAPSSLSCHYFHRQVTKIILPGPDTPGGSVSSASTALIIIPAPPSESLSECPARVESWPHQIPGAGRCGGSFAWSQPRTEVTGQLALRLRCQLRQYLERRGTGGNKKRLHETFYSDAAHDAAVTGQRGTGLT